MDREGNVAGRETLMRGRRDFIPIHTGGRSGTGAPSARAAPIDNGRVQAPIGTFCILSGASATNWKRFSCFGRLLSFAGVLNGLR